MGVGLGINHISIHPHIEDSLAPLDELGVQGKFVLQLRGYTSRFGKIVSLPAVFDLDLHQISCLHSIVVVFHYKRSQKWNIGKIPALRDRLLRSLP